MSFRGAALAALGGALGSALRYGAGALVQRAAGTAFPVGTLAVNVAGCFAIGLLAGWADRRGALTPDAQALLAVGVLGGFTTFSAFANDTVVLVRGATPSAGVLNVAASVGLCLAAVWCGRTVTAFLVR